MAATKKSKLESRKTSGRKKQTREVEKGTEVMAESESNVQFQARAKEVN